MIKILHVNNTMNIGGIETFLLNVFNDIDKEKYSFAFLCYSDETFDYQEKILSLGGTFFRIDNPKNVSLFKHYHQIKEVLKKEKFDVVHCHTYFDSAIVLLAAKISGIKVRIAHSHTTEGKNNVSAIRKLKWFICSNIINFVSTHRLACSLEAGEALFRRKKFEIIPNGILVDKFQFNEQIRKEIRKKLHIHNQEIVIGHIGRLSPEKNHMFMLEILNELKKKTKEKYKMIFVGGGNFKNEIYEKINKLDLIDDVILVGSVTDAYKYYNAFDLFLFPSVYEGLGISLIEAQANGLYCLASQSVPMESKLIDEVEFLDAKNIHEFTERIIKNEFKRNKLAFEIIKNSKYSIYYTISQLTKIYNQKK